MLNVNAVGRLTQDISLRSKDNMVFLNNTLAVSTKYKECEYTFFLNFSLFGNQAKIFADLCAGKGARVCLDGILQVNTYTNSQGLAQSQFIVTVNNFEIIDFKKKEDDTQNNNVPSPI